MSTNFLTYSRRKWRERGYHVDAAEQVQRFGGKVRRKDLFGFADLVAYPDPHQDLDPAVVWLQVTSWGHVPTRLRKIQNETTGKGQWEHPIADAARAVLESGDRIVIEGWHQPDGPGTRWEWREREVTLEDLEDLE